MILNSRLLINLWPYKLVWLWSLAFVLLASIPNSFAKNQNNFSTSELPMSSSEEARLSSLVRRVPTQGPNVLAEIVREDQCSALDWKFLFRLGEVFERAKQFDRAETAYSMSISRLKPLLEKPNPKNYIFAAAVFDLTDRLTTLYIGEIDSRIKRKRPAAEIDSLFEKALKLAPRNVELWSRYSKFLHECGREEEAVDAEIEVLKFRPTYHLSR